MYKALCPCLTFFLLLPCLHRAQQTKSEKIREAYTKVQTAEKSSPFDEINQFSIQPYNTGAIAEDTGHGPWNYYDEKGKLLLSYHYARGRVEVLNGPPDGVSIPVWRNGQFIADTVDTPPLHKGEQGEFEKRLDARLEIPETLLRNGIGGISIASFTVDETGRIEETTIDQLAHPDLKKPLLLALESLDSRWFPARRDQQSLKSRVTVIFDIQFFHDRAVRYSSPFVRKPGVFIVEKVFVPRRPGQKS